MHIAMTVGDMDPRTGGPPQVVAGSAAALARRGHRVSVFTRDTISDSTAIERQFAGLPVDLWRFPPDIPTMLGRSSTMKRAFAAQCEAIDVLHVHGIWEGHLAQLAGVMRDNGKPVVISSHGMLDSWSMRQSAWKKKLALAIGGTGQMLAHADAVVFGTEEESLEGCHAVRRARHVIVPNGIDSAAIARISDDLDPGALLARLPVIRTWNRTILYFSRIHPKKGLSLLIDALAGHRHRLDGTGLLIVGIPQDAKYLATIQRTIKQNCLDVHVAITTDLTGPDARVAFAVADVFALPSHQEGFSMAIVEAMAAGKPLLITDKCHMSEVVDWQAGFVVPDTVEGLAQGLEQILDLDDEALLRMGRNGRRVATEKFDWAEVAARLESIYTQALVG